MPIPPAVLHHSEVERKHDAIVCVPSRLEVSMSNVKRAAHGMEAKTGETVDMAYGEDEVVPSTARKAKPEHIHRWHQEDH